ncbi:MAG TPA: transaldolase [Lachnospiraceae bacterium]|jgi:transaldolase|nr:transaldolase [Lachnospiraceae bacterium]
MKFEDLKIKIFADGADINGMKEEYSKGYVTGFTTNPTLMKKAGVKDYVPFAKEVVTAISDLPLSLEVFADDFDTMEKEAMVISALGDNVYVKIPITNSKGESSIPLIKKLSAAGLKLNVTAIMTIKQVKETVEAFADGTQNVVSVFAGRVMDTGVDAMPLMKEVAAICKTKPGTESLWASCREVYNIIQADECGVDIITVTNAILGKLPMLGKDLTELSLETVQMFVNDGKSLGFSII